MAENEADLAAGYRRNELLVVHPHAPLVMTLLDDHRVAWELAGESLPLGLTRLLLRDSGGARAGLQGAVESAPGAGAWQGDRPPPDQDRDLDWVLFHLRALFAAQYSGWTPTVGKNRLVGQVVGGGEVSHGGAGGPALADVPWPPLDRRGPGRGVRVGVLDTALYPQPWLAGAWLDDGASQLATDGRPAWAPSGHATFVSGLVLSQAPGATVVVQRVLDEHGSAQDSFTVATRIVEFGDSGLDILNMSFCAATEDGQPPLALARAIDRLDPDLVVVAAAGNHAAVATGVAQPIWPAALDDVIAVGATTTNGDRLGFSPEEPWVDVDAPGDSLKSTYLEGRVRVAPDDSSPTLSARRPDAPEQDEEFRGWATWSGTSFAAALVSGAIAAQTRPGSVPAAEAWQRLRRGADRRRGAAGIPFLAIQPKV